MLMLGIYLWLVVRYFFYNFLNGTRRTRNNFNVPSLSSGLTYRSTTTVYTSRETEDCLMGSVPLTS